MINYILQVLLFQALFLVVYDFFLQKETFFKWNRVYLLATPILSFVIPLLKFESIQKIIPQQYIVQLPTIFLNPQVFIEQGNQNNMTLNFISIAFYIGLGLFTLLFFIRLTKILQLIASNTIIKKKDYSLVLLEKRQSAFSFFKYIFVNEHLLKHEDLQIIKHELIHCKQNHTIDLLFFELLKIVLWFNPLIYVYQKRITLLHEYISDAEVVLEIDKRSYFNKLLAETFNVENISFINQFFKHSLIKKRIVMITKEKSQKMKRLKYLLIVPLLMTMLVYMSCTDGIQNENNVNQEIIELPKEKNNNEDVPFAIIEEVPVFPGCEGSNEELRLCLQEKIRIHINSNFNKNLAENLGLSAGVKRIFVIFKIDKEGNITDIQSRAPHKVLQEEAIRVVNLLPKMTPGKHKGEYVGVKYSLPIAFKVGNDTIKEATKKSEVTYKDDEDVPFAIIEDVPVFPGCAGTKEELRLCLQDKITAHINSNFNIELAKNLGLSSGVKRIFVIFKIDKEGNIANVMVRAPHQKLADEAKRVINLLPKMIPGKQRGKNVGVKYSLPIAFKVE